MATNEAMGKHVQNSNHVAMESSRRILNEIILKMATESLGTFKEDFLSKDLPVQKRVLSKYVPRQGFLSRMMGLKKLKNNNLNKARGDYYNDIINKKYEDIVSNISDNNIHGILTYIDVSKAAKEIKNPDLKIYDWLKSDEAKKLGANHEVVQWAIKEYFPFPPPSDEQLAAAEEASFNYAAYDARRREAVAGAAKQRADEVASLRAQLAERADEVASLRAQLAARDADMLAPPPPALRNTGAPPGEPTWAELRMKSAAVEAAQRRAKRANKHQNNYKEAAGGAAGPSSAAFAPNDESRMYESAYGGGSRRKSQRRKRGRKARRTRRH
jgi:hypothetical protein